MTHPLFLYILSRILFSILSLLAARYALALWLLICGWSLNLYTCQLWVDEDTAAILTRDNLLVHLDIQLALRRNLVEATTAGITLHVYDAQSVAGTLADALEAGEQTWLNLLLKLKSLLCKALLLFAGLSHDVLKLRTLLYQSVLTVGLLLLSLVKVVLTLTHLCQALANLLVAKLDFQLLELDFLARTHGCCSRSPAGCDSAPG